MSLEETNARDLTARIDALSESQRAALRRMIAQRTGVDPGSSGRTKLTAFVTVDVGSGRPAPTPDELREHLRGSLPEHMIPASVRTLNEIPRLPNGKVDAAAIAALPEENVDSLSAGVAPRTETERQLAAIWRDVLQVEEISVHDPFLELGGDSILSIHVTSRANQLGLGLSPNDIFNFPTIAELATRCVNGTVDVSAESDDPSTVSKGQAASNDRAPLFLVHVGIKLASRLRQHLGPDQPLFCFSAHWHRADLDLDATVELLAGECLAELRTLQPTGPYFIGGYSMGAPIALEMAQQLHREGDAVRMLFLLDPPPMRERFGVGGAEPVNRIHFADALSEGPPRTFVDKLSNHLAVLSALPLRARAAYLWRESLAQIRYRVLEPLRLSTAVAMRRMGLGVPQALRDPYVLMVYVRAWSRYEAAAYPGDLVIFSGRSTEAEETMESWQDLTQGDVWVETFQGFHLDFVMDDELVDEWAHRLRDVLVEYRLR